MKYSEVRTAARRLRELADFIEKRGVLLPTVSVTTQHYSWLSSSDYVQVDGQWESVLNEGNTRENVRRFIDAVGNCDKEYQSDRIRIVKNYSDGAPMLIGSVDRALTCKKVPTGKTIKHEARIEPAREEPEYEWVCSDNMSLLKLVN